MLAVAIIYAIAALISTTFLMLKHEAIRQSAEEASRQRREEGYRLDYFRPYLWMMATWPRRVVFALSELVVAVWLFWAAAR
jgi:hypothetical protein